MKRTLTSIAAAGVVLGSFVPAAFAATTSHKVVVTKAPSYNSRTVSLGSYNANVKGIAAKDGSVTTEFLPVWYVEQGLKALGYTATWDGNNMILNITTPDGVTADTSNPVIGTGDIAIQINGTMVQSAPHLVAKDPASGVNTTFVPVWYLEQVMKRLNFINSYDGHTWKEVANDFAISGANTIAVGGKDTLSLTSKTQTVDASKVTWSVDGNGAAVVDQNGNFVASAAGTYNVTATYEGVTVPAKVVVYGAVVGATVVPASTSMVANGVSTQTVKVNAVDAAGNVVSNYNGPVTLTDGGKWIVTSTTVAGVNVLGTTLTVNAVNGVATFTIQAPTSPGVSDTLTSSGLTGIATGVNPSYGTATVSSTAQVATTVKLSAPKTLTANTSGNTATVSVEVEDQSGNPMLTGSYGVTLNLSGSATFADGTTGPEYVTFNGNNTPGNPSDSTVTVKSIGGGTGAITVTGASTGLTSGTATINAVIAGQATQLGLTSDVTSFTEGAGNLANFSVSQLDANGNASLSGEGTNYTVTVTKDGKAATDVTVNGGALSSTGTATVTSNAFTFAADNANADAGTYQVVVSDNNASGTLKASAPVTITIGADSSAEYYSFGGSSVQVAAASPSTTLTISTTDKYGNPLPVSGATFKLNATSSTLSGSATINGTAVTGDGSATPVVVTTDATGTAKVTFAPQPYNGTTWTVAPASATDASGKTISPFTVAAGSEKVTIATTAVTQIAGSIKDTNSLSNYYNSTTSAISGDSFSLTIKAEDSYNNPVNSDTVVITPSSGLDLSGTGLAQDATYATTGAYDATLTNGQITISGLQAVGAGAQTLKVTDSTAPTAPSTTVGVNVVAGAFNHFDIFDTKGNLLRSNSTAQNDDFAVNTLTPVVVKAVDANDNPVVTPSAVTVSLSSNAGKYEFRGTGANDITNVVLTAGSTGVTVNYINDGAAASYDNLTASLLSTGVTGNLVTTTAGVAATPAVAAVDTIAVTTGSTTAATATVTVDGTVVNVPLDGTGSTTSDATAIQTALAANATVNAAYTVAVSGSNVTLTQKTASATAPVVSFDPTTTGAAATATVTTPYAAATSGTKGVYTDTVGAATNQGNVTVTVDGTSVNVAVTAGETAAQVAAAINTALNANSTITAKYTVTNAAGSADVVFTQTTPSATAPVVVIA